MYYLTTEYELKGLMSKEARKIITIGNKTCFMDMYDYFPTANPKTVIMSEEEIKDFIKDGYKTKSEAENDKDLKKAIKDFIGPFANVSFKVMSEDELLQRYNALN